MGASLRTGRLHTFEISASPGKEREACTGTLRSDYLDSTRPNFHAMFFLPHTLSFFTIASVKCLEIVVSNVFRRSPVMA